MALSACPKCQRNELQEHRVETQENGEPVVRTRTACGACGFPVSCAITYPQRRQGHAMPTPPQERPLPPATPASTLSPELEDDDIQEPDAMPAPHYHALPLSGGGHHSAAYADAAAAADHARDMQTIQQERWTVTSCAHPAWAPPSPTTSDFPY